MLVNLVSNICQTDPVTSVLTVAAESRILTDGRTHKFSANISLTRSINLRFKHGALSLNQAKWLAHLVIIKASVIRE